MSETTPNPIRTTVSKGSYGVEVNTGIRSVNSKLSNNYIFDASEGTVKVLDADFKHCLYIVNTTVGQTIFNPWVTDMRGDQDGNVMILNADTSLMNDGDNLLIQYYSEEGLSVVNDVLLLKVLEDLLTQQKITNLHLSHLTDETYKAEDL